MPELKFSKSQMVINFLWSAEHESMKGLVHPAELVRANPLPTAVQHASPTIVYPTSRLWPTCLTKSALPSQWTTLVTWSPSKQPRA